MKKRMLSILLAMCMLISVMPMYAHAEEGAVGGTIEWTGYHDADKSTFFEAGTVSVSGDVVTFDDEITLKHVAEDDVLKRAAGYYVGVKVKFPNGVSENGKLKVTKPDASVKNYTINDVADGEGDHVYLWQLVTPENAASGEMLTYTYEFDWAGDSSNIQSFTVNVNPNKLTLVNGEETVYQGIYLKDAGFAWSYADVHEGFTGMGDETIWAILNASPAVEGYAIGFKNNGNALFNAESGFAIPAGKGSKLAISFLNSVQNDTKDFVENGDTITVVLYKNEVEVDSKDIPVGANDLRISGVSIEDNTATVTMSRAIKGDYYVSVQPDGGDPFGYTISAYDTTANETIVLKELADGTYTVTIAPLYDTEKVICRDSFTVGVPECKHEDVRYTNNGDGTHTVKCNADGCAYSEKFGCEYVQGECVCGAKKEIVVKHNLTLESGLDFSFFVEKSDVAESGLTATITQNRADGQVVRTIIDQDDWEDTPDDGVSYWRIRYTDVAAKEMADTLTLVITDGNGDEIVTDTSSVMAYANQRIQDSTDDDEKNLMNALLAYGSAAQIFFDYNTENLAGGNAAAYIAEELENNAGSFTVKHNLTLDCIIDFSFFVEKSDVAESGLTATITQERADGQGVYTIIDQDDWEDITDNGVSYWRIRYTDVAAKEMADTLTLVITDGNDNEIVTDTSSVEAYANQRIQDSNDANEDNLMNALLAYGSAAQTYFNNHNG